MPILKNLKNIANKTKNPEDVAYYKKTEKFSCSLKSTS